MAGNTPEAAVTIDTQGRILEFNGPAEKMFGYQAAKARGRLMADLLIPERLRAAHSAGFRRYLETGEEQLLDERIEVPALKADGTEITVELVVTELRLPGTRVFTAVLRDVSELRGIQGELMLSERFHRTLVERSPVVITTVGSGRPWRTSDAAARLMGSAPASEAEMLAAVHPDDHDVLHEFIAAVSAGRLGPRDAVDVRVRAADGSWHVLHTAAENLLSEPAVHGVVLYSTDVTPARRAEQRQRLESSRLRALLDTLHAGVLLLDQDGRVVVVNETFVRFGAVPRAADTLPGLAVGEHPDLFGELLAGLPIAGQGVRPDLSERARAGAVLSEELRLGEDRVLERDCVPITVDGEAAGHLVHLRDVTERARAQQLLTEQNTELAALANLKTQFVASVSHELRTPLTSILSFTELLADDDGRMSPDQRHHVDVILRNAHRLHRLVADLLLLAKLESGTLPLQIEPVDVAGLMRAAVAEHESAATAKGLTISCFAPPGPPIDGETLRLAQVLDNLIGNAVKFTPTGGKVTVRGAHDGRTWQIEVADTGIGIDPAEADRLFTPFFRTISAREHGIPGTGLGLMISRALVEAHGGTLNIASAEGGGAAVTIRLPMAAARSGTHPSEEEAG